MTRLDLIKLRHRDAKSRKADRERRWAAVDVLDEFRKEEDRGEENGRDLCMVPADQDGREMVMATGEAGRGVQRSVG